MTLERARIARTHLGFAIAIARIHLQARQPGDALVLDHLDGALAEDASTFEILLAHLAPLAHEEETRVVLEAAILVAQEALNASASPRWQSVVQSARDLHASHLRERRASPVERER